MIARAFRFAWLRVRREPGRTALAVLGVTAIGALLFDMLLLSNGLLVSFRERLDRSGFDVRAMASDSAVLSGPPIPRVSALAGTLRQLPSIAAVQRLSIESADVEGHADGRHVSVAGVDLAAPAPWTIVQGAQPRESDAPPAVVVNRNMANQFGLQPGSGLTLEGRCGGATAALPVRARVTAVADFQNDSVDALTAAMSYRALAALCATDADQADMLLVTSRGDDGPAAAAAEIRAAAPALYVVTNAQLVERFGRVEFSYFRQLSSVLAVVTLFFGLLLVAVLLTVSVNQQLGQIAALRALGFSRARVMAGVFCESVLLIGIGGAVAVPLGLGLSLWLDAILRALPGIPADAHFFVFTPRAVFLHAALMAAGAAAAAAYPMRLVAVLPVAATLRQEAE